jgi:hypothetical protein
MAYEGEVMTTCGVVNIDLSHASIIAVSGDSINLCGHLLLYSPSGGGTYFHVTGDSNASGLARLQGYPMYMSETGYRRYLKETKKMELRRRSVTLPNPAGAYLYLESLLAEKWTWKVLPDNCVTFVEEVVHAGGGNWGSYSNCPTIATADSVSDRIAKFYQWMESGIFNVYGVSR